jgi:propionyl-CoA carboxylase alpha chain
MLIANRGEIAVRIMRTARAMGIETAAVYSDFDRHALHVRQADLSVPIGGAAARDSYLNIDKIIDAARRSGAGAIHPGYGFLAENAGFAAACEQAGLTFIGPRSEVVRAMGSKIEARKLAREAGVPVAPDATERDFAAIGFPILIKASAGGGGRGMRIVHSAGEFPAALAAARGEAERAFSDGSLLLEKYIEGARHVEIQIFGDLHGHLMQLYERDCSIQRRHQKVIEESPSPAVTPDIRRRMAEAALALARKIGYTNAGTVEFLLSPAGEFYFIEVNTRIQVEHPVTEMVTGLDLIRLQIEIAQGGTLPAQPPQVGHAIEARLYAEDPANDFAPSTGTLHVWQPPRGTDGVRVDAGVEEGTSIGIYYDPLLAKIVAHGPDRETAIQKLSHALKEFAAQGVKTNREYLLDILEHEEFCQGRAHTGLRISPRSQADAKAVDEVCAAVVAAYIEWAERAQRPILPSIPIRFRNNPYPALPMKVEIGGHEYKVTADTSPATVIGVGRCHVDALVDGIRYTFYMRRHEDEYFVHSHFAQRTVTRLSRYPRGASSASHESANSPMPGQVLRIQVRVGQRVKAGDSLLSLEAMKMEQTIKATMDGIVQAILVEPGAMVAPGQMLVEIQATEDVHEHANSPAAND